MSYRVAPLPFVGLALGAIGSRVGLRPLFFTSSGTRDVIVPVCVSEALDAAVDVSASMDRDRERRLRAWSCWGFRTMLLSERSHRESTLRLVENATSSVFSANKSVVSFSASYLGLVVGSPFFL